MPDSGSLSTCPRFHPPSPKDKAAGHWMHVMRPSQFFGIFTRPGQVLPPRNDCVTCNRPTCRLCGSKRSASIHSQQTRVYDGITKSVSIFRTHGDCGQVIQFELGLNSMFSTLIIFAVIRFLNCNFLSTSTFRRKGR